jgi:hypothetical protein
MANGNGGFNFSELSMSGQHNGFQPRLDTIRTGFGSPEVRRFFFCAYMR